MTTVLIDNAAVVADGVARAGSVLVEGKVIAAVAFAAEERAALRARAGEVVDAVGHYLMPGMVDAHSHGYSALLRGTENSLPLELWALYTTVYGSAHNEASMRAAVLLGAAEKLRGGITATLDHAPNAALAPAAIAAHEESGLRAAYAHFLHDISDYELFDLPSPLPPGPPRLNAAGYAAGFADLVAQARGGSGRVSVQLGPNAPQRCTPEAWALWRELRDRHDVGVHTHLLETRAQASLNTRWPGGIVGEMRRQGLLEGQLTCAHGVWLGDAEMEILARAGVTLSHNPASNLMLGSGMLRYGACRACGLRLALGHDSDNTGGRADLFAIMRLAMTLPRREGGDPREWPGAGEMLTAATEGGAAALGLAGRLGRIAAGQLADLVLVTRRAAGSLAGAASVEQLVQHAGPEHVRSVMINGRWVMRDGRILAFDEDAMLSQAQEQAEILLARAAPRLPALHAALPALTERFLLTCA